MALYRNIAGNGSGVGRVAPDAYFTRYDEGGGGGGGYYMPSGAVLQTAAVDKMAPVDEVFYDPGYVGYPAQETVFDVRENEPVIPIQQVEPTPGAEIQTMAPTSDVATTVEVPDQLTGKNLFPLLTLALLAATMVKGEDLFGGNQRVVFLGGLGLLYYQLHKRAATPAP